jgi:prolipoprotein diacylglyceryltransferase
MNSEILGITTKLPWCVIFQNIDNICRHPIQLYAAIGKLALFLYLLSIKKFKNYKPGLICWMFILLISIGRFPLDFLRDDPRLYGLAPGQWFSLILIIISIIALKKLNFLDKKLNQKDYRSIWSEAA